MKKSVKVTIQAILLISILLIVSCNRVPAGEKPRDTAAILQQVQTGTQGVEISILPNYPPAQVYDQNELVAIVEIKNRGNDDLEANDCFIQISGFDPNIILGGFNQPRSCTENAGSILEGKNVYNLEGSANQLEFKSSTITLPPGVFDYKPKLNFVTCYNYQTIANPSVCIDPLFYQVTAEQRTCTPHDVVMGGGQGGPVGVSLVGVDMVGRKAIFEINVKNFGSGRVLSPYSDLRSCGQASLEYTDLDKVGYDVQMTGGSLLDCKPRDGLVRLTNNLGKIICQFDVPGASAFETPLTVKLNYNYIQSFQKGIQIVKTPE